VSGTSKEYYTSYVPKRAALKTNLWPLLLFFWKMVMCHAALIMKRTMKTPVIGMSTFFFGVPPSAHVVGK
jgi:hypothetical protein